MGRVGIIGTSAIGMAKEAGSIKTQHSKMPAGVGAAYNPSNQTIHLPHGVDRKSFPGRAAFRHELIHALRHKRGKYDENVTRPGLRNAAKLYREEMAAYTHMNRRNPSRLAKLKGIWQAPIGAAASTRHQGHASHRLLADLSDIGYVGAHVAGAYGLGKAYEHIKARRAEKKKEEKGTRVKA